MFFWRVFFSQSSKRCFFTYFKLVLWLSIWQLFVILNLSDMRLQLKRIIRIFFLCLVEFENFSMRIFSLLNFIPGAKSLFLLQKAACNIMLLHNFRIIDVWFAIWNAITRYRCYTASLTTLIFNVLILSSSHDPCTSLSRWICKITFFYDLSEFSCFHFELFNSSFFLTCKV